jgi:hypothetical protein
MFLVMERLMKMVVKFADLLALCLALHVLKN